ncbi:predicted protein [Uncinocarpus reesii 1704]|uniref:Uncharacterized protein n=1 Tax=Uncinocarpus reesii (strain UAMH 1704) TaxID=336963 RepID=C4JZ45_UNCRE|nr:uncharacterized protein UREG_07446 [Uncinocarpus reesii 1704]EEP82581.1 predicted protein [Uncinocarpus reesii 1704]
MAHVASSSQPTNQPTTKTTGRSWLGIYGLEALTLMTFEELQDFSENYGSQFPVNALLNPDHESEDEMIREILRKMGCLEKSG